jgi:hypothetical protein
MTALAFALALASSQGPPQPPTWASAWRLVATPTVHVGLRPAAFVDNEGRGGRVELGLGATLQVTVAIAP